MLVGNPGMDDTVAYPSGGSSNNLGQSGDKPRADKTQGLSFYSS